MTKQPTPEQTPERIAEIRKRVKKATEGPWTVAPRSDTDETANVVANYERLADGKEQAHWIAELDAQIDFGVDEEEHFQTLEGNAEFIAHAREDVPYLLSQLDALTATLAHLTQENERLADRLGTAQGTIELLKGSREQAEATLARVTPLIANLQTHAREQGWQDVDEPIAALLDAALVDPPVSS